MTTNEGPVILGKRVHNVGAPCHNVGAGDEVITDPDERADVTCPDPRCQVASS